MATRFSYKVRHGDTVRTKEAAMAGGVNEYTTDHLIKHLDDFDLHRSADEIFDIKVIAQDSKPVVPPEGMAAVVSGSTLKDSRTLLNAPQKKKTIYRVAGEDAPVEPAPAAPAAPAEEPAT